MKTLSIDGQQIDAGAFVVMMENKGWLRPICSCSTSEIANSLIAALLEADAGLTAIGGIPGQVKYYFVPVEVRS